MSAQTKEWKPRPLPNVKRHRVAPQKPWQAWVDPASGTMKYFDPNISVSIFYNRRPPGVTQVVWLDKPPPQALVGTVVYDSADDEDDDDPYGLFASPSPEVAEEIGNVPDEQTSETTLTGSKTSSVYSIDVSSHHGGVSDDSRDAVSAEISKIAEAEHILEKTAVSTSNKKVYRRRSRVLPHKPVSDSLGTDWKKKPYVPIL